MTELEGDDHLRPAPSQHMDEVDHRIVAHLRRDGRMAFKALAAELSLTEATVRARVRRLEEGDSLRVVAVTDYEAVGYSMMLAKLRVARPMPWLKIWPRSQKCSPCVRWLALWTSKPSRLPKIKRALLNYYCA
jgi:DNA-binding Lrp family transcriptional regulator